MRKQDLARTCTQISVLVGQPVVLPLSEVSGCLLVTSHFHSHVAVIYYFLPVNSSLLLFNFEKVPHHCQPPLTQVTKDALGHLMRDTRLQISSTYRGSSGLRGFLY